MSHFVHHVPVRFQEVDSAGIVFFSRIFEYHHDAYEAWMRSLGFPIDPMIKDRHHMLPLAHAEADYHAPILLGQTVEVRIRVASVGTTSFAMVSWIGTPDGDDLATVRTVHVCIDRESRRPAPFPDAFRSVLLHHLKAAEEA
jgi:YbgC/YbaW family acyl-CoA thioester hydrolase